MKTVRRWAFIIGAMAALELAFGIDATGGKVALVALVWCCLAVPLSLAAGQLLHGMRVADRDYRGY
jgi:hypothetical protein